MKKYTVLMDGNEKCLEITPLNEHLFRIVIDGVPYDVDVRFFGSDCMSLLMENRLCDLSYFFHGDELELHFRNQYFRSEILNERKMRMRRAGSNLEHSGPEIVKAFMPGKVVEVSVSPGDHVIPGTGVLIIEAMKMENEIFCQNAGIIRSVHVKAGQAVENDQVLIEIDPEMP